MLALVPEPHPALFGNPREGLKNDPLKLFI